MDPNLRRCSLIITSSRILINQSALLCASPSIFNRANRFCTASTSSLANTENCIQIRCLNISVSVCLLKGIQRGFNHARNKADIIICSLCPWFVSILSTQKALEQNIHEYGWHSATSFSYRVSLTKNNNTI